MYTESPSLNDEYPENDVDASDLHAEGTSSHRAQRLRRGTSLRSSASARFALNRPSITRRTIRVLAPPSIAVLIGVSATLAWQSYGGLMIRAWAPSLGWLLPRPARLQRLPSCRRSLSPWRLTLPS